MNQIIDSLSPNFDERDKPVSMLMLHYTGMKDAASAIAWLRNPESKVSCHYLVSEDGQILRMVPEEKRAWHAGRSYWRGIQNLNSCSIGIEIVNPGHEFGYRPLPDAQMRSVIALSAAIVARHGIAPANVVGHSDIAPARKQDPGELFPWARLAKLRLALPRPTRNLMDPNWTQGGFLLALNRFGYDVTEPIAAIRAFQRRFRPERIDVAAQRNLSQTVSNSRIDKERDRPKEPLEAFPLESIQMMGTITQNKETFALVKAGPNLYRVRKGNYMGQNFGVITGIDESLEALDMQAGRIRVGAGDFSDFVLSQLGGEDEHGISQCTQLACFIDNVTMPPHLLEAAAEVRVGLIDILKHEHAVRIVLHGLQQRGPFRCGRGR